MVKNAFLVFAMELDSYSDDNAFNYKMSFVFSRNNLQTKLE